MTRPDPPYLRIVEDIRGRITDGVLRPGDVVPSARRISRDWAVAIATATKVHAALRQEGLTQVVPGVGTVVASAPPKSTVRAAGTRSRGRTWGEVISREQIVRAAIEIADTEGMSELSMRRIATELGAATMSLYRHVASKDELVLHMIDTAIGEEPLPPRGSEGWRERLELIAHKVWSAFRRHPWLAPTMSLTRPQLTPNALALADEVLRAFEGTGLGLEGRLYAHVTLFSFVRGVATAFEPEAEAERETGLTSDEWMQTQEASLQDLIPSGSLVARMALGDFDFDLDKLFAFGLARLLDGLAVHLERRGAVSA